MVLEAVLNTVRRIPSAPKDHNELGPNRLEPLLLLKPIIFARLNTPYFLA